MPGKSSARAKKTNGKSVSVKRARKTPKATPARRTVRSPQAAVKPASAAAVHEIVHWEIQSQDPDALQAFYRATLGWEIKADNPMHYGMVASGGESGINGGITGSAAGGSRVLVYAAVPSIPAMLKKIEEHGGKTVMPRTDIGPVVMGLYLDPEGNMMGLVEG